jgi:hypothetical protein
MKLTVQTHDKCRQQQRKIEELENSPISGNTEPELHLVKKNSRNRNTRAGNDLKTVAYRHTSVSVLACSYLLEASDEML